MRFGAGIIPVAAKRLAGRIRWFCALTLTCLAAAAPGQAAAPAAATTPGPTPPPAIAPGDLPGQARSDLDKLAALAPVAGNQTAPAAGDRNVQELSERLRQLTIDTNAANDSSSLEDLRELQVDWHQLLAACRELDAALANQARPVESANRQVQEIAARWQAAERAAAGTAAPTASLRLIHDVLDAADAAGQRLQQTRGRVLEIQAQAEQLRTGGEAGAAAVDQSIDAAVKRLFVRNDLPLWERWALASPAAAAQPERFAEQREALARYVSGHAERFALHALVFLGLLAGIFALRRGLHGWVQGNRELKRAAPIFEVPVSAALALSFLVAAPAYFDAPNLLHALVGAAVLPPVIVLLRRLLDARFRPELYALAGFFFVEQLRRALAVFPLVGRWLFCVEMLAGILLCLPLSRTARVGAKHWMAWLYRVAVLVLAAALAANAWGYVQLGLLLGVGTLRSAYLALCLYALRRILEGLLVIALRVRPLVASRIVRQHADLVQRRTVGLLRGAGILAWAVFTLGVFQLRAPLTTQAHRVLGFALRVGTVELSPGGLLSFGVALWLSILVSRLARFFLDEEVYERFTLAPGLPYAISTMVNYLVLIVGLLIALALLGVPLSNFTVVAGALSVGLGFGLQNIINNFVSGLILLFERPVKVGDLIQIGDNVGEVRRIGIRASVVRTREGSDIILPNGNLISNQVTNWTYSDQRGAVEVSLSVAHGPDRRRVMNLLKAAAAAALEKAEPEVYVTAVTAASTSFTVRAWTTYTGDNLRARSDLSLALTEALDREQLPLV